MAAVPHEVLTSLRCYRDAAPAPRTVDELLPENVRISGGEDVSVLLEQQVILRHPLAAHVPLWCAHVLRLVDATENLGRLYPSQWRTKKWSVEDVLRSDAVSQLWEAIQNALNSDVTMLRASLRIAQDGTSRAVIAPMARTGLQELCVRLDTQPTQLQRPSAAYKTDLREEYDASRRRVNADLMGTAPNTCFDALLWYNDSHSDTHYLTESSIANIILEVPGKGWFTPPFQGLLPGLLVRELVRRGMVLPQALDIAYVQKHLQSGAQLWLGNAVRGLFPVKLDAPHCT